GRVSSRLVLNQNYEPLNVCNTRRALVLVDGGKAEVLEHAFGNILTPSRAIPRPSVIRLVYMIKRPRPRVRLTRREVFMRDQYTCQYCGLKTRDLTLDHVIPRHRGGPHTWENLVSACRSCNHRKGGKALEECRMPLRRGAGLRLTPQRLAIAHEVLMQDHPTAADVYEAVRVRFPTMGLATVYATLNVMVERGLLRPLAFENAVRFDANVTPHANLI